MGIIESIKNALYKFRRKHRRSLSIEERIAIIDMVKETVSNYNGEFRRAIAAKYPGEIKEYYDQFSLTASRISNYDGKHHVMFKIISKHHGHELRFDPVLFQNEVDKLATKIAQSLSKKYEISYWDKIEGIIEISKR